MFYRAATDADGKPFEIIRVLLPSPIEQEHQQVEDWGGEGWSFRDAFPGKVIKPINATALNLLGGGPHCVTKNLPDTGLSD